MTNTQAQALLTIASCQARHLLPAPSRLRASYIQAKSNPLACQDRLNPHLHAPPPNRPRSRDLATYRLPLRRDAVPGTQWIQHLDTDMASGARRARVVAGELAGVGAPAAALRLGAGAAGTGVGIPAVIDVDGVVQCMKRILHRRCIGRCTRVDASPTVHPLTATIVLDHTISQQV